MTFTPNFLGIFSKLYGSNDAMNISKALLVAVVGFMTVVIVLAVIALFIKFIAFIFALAAKKATSKVEITPIKEESAPKNEGVALPETESQGNLELIGVDEATAAILMALVSYKTEIPLNRLAFRSIKLVEEDK